MTLQHPAYETPRRVLPHAQVVLQDNPGPMTLDGTNTWLLRAGQAEHTVVVDPGQTDDVHLDGLLAAAPSVALILVTHGHRDHVEAAAALHERTGAPVRANDAAHCLSGAPLTDGERLPTEAAGVRVQVLATPGHTADSVCFVLDDGAAVLTGDTILGRGTTVVAHPDGALGPYLRSLATLRRYGHAAVLPGHGPELAAVGEVAAMYLAHREARLDQVRSALAALGPDASVRAVVERVYVGVDPAVWWAAELSVAAQLEYLRDQAGTNPM